MPRGFLLQAALRIESGAAVVHLHGVLQGGGAFLVRETRVVPRFWIRAADSARARTAGARVREPLVPLRTFEGADGMKTGFICDSGYNVVASATREGHKLVAVVLGARTDPLRDARATDLLDQGFRRYFWKSLFSAKLDTLEQDAELSEEAVSLRSTICAPRKAKPTKRTRKKKRSEALSHANVLASTMPALPNFVR